MTGNGTATDDAVAELERKLDLLLVRLDAVATRLDNIHLRLDAWVNELDEMRRELRRQGKTS